MPTNRTPLNRAAKYPGLVEIQTALVYDRPLPETRDIREDIQIWAWRGDSAAYRGAMSGSALWAARRAEVLAFWIEVHPGTRPSGWWRWEAPGPRQQVGGIGRPWGFEQLTRGIPIIWNYGPWRDLWASPPTPIDPANPPIFESQATYLERYELLLPGERRRLRDSDFTPERITDIIDFTGEGDDDARNPELHQGEQITAPTARRPGDDERVAVTVLRPGADVDRSGAVDGRRGA
jgi:hypothetical protein